ncbi:MAG: hypothetical protein Fur0042_13400 [Cyanophyceae cyanobacterium]
MAYGDFSLAEVLRRFELCDEYGYLFPDLEPVEPSPWLLETLALGRGLALPGGSEKARSEFLIVPILLELERTYGGQLAIYSGRNFEVDRDRGLTGECDFLLGKGATALAVRSPIFCLVEAKRDDVEGGIGQCAAQMVGAALFNAAQGEPSAQIFGCVTTGEVWQFLRLRDRVLMVDRDRYYLNPLREVLGCLTAIVAQQLQS